MKLTFAIELFAGLCAVLAVVLASMTTAGA